MYSKTILMTFLCICAVVTWSHSGILIPPPPPHMSAGGHTFFKHRVTICTYYVLALGLGNWRCIGVIWSNSYPPTAICSVAVLSLTSQGWRSRQECQSVRKVGKNFSKMMYNSGSPSLNLQPLYIRFVRFVHFVKTSSSYIHSMK